MGRAEVTKGTPWLKMRTIRSGRTKVPMLRKKTPKALVNRGRSKDCAIKEQRPHASTAAGDTTMARKSDPQTSNF